MLAVAIDRLASDELKSLTFLPWDRGVACCGVGAMDVYAPPSQKPYELSLIHI